MLKVIACLAGKVLGGCIGDLGSKPAFTKDGGLRNWMCTIFV